ncbi:hypothetical protein AGABI2DRAFT_186557 [Agaricus bisporus var. bisporus H97]|uniref:hypothetical protein n=1 Tax=Agaricus bisporus var. bisporus (strain H97 / ATCC MYA-4626 / FGSC 10389) TaxID=936046 RepID=UPI00029F65B1|nr:hypothetical protein AGABI2DRAFT_186557 [Agaricus bisporus var. bisporus H97]EKV45856.1 hypothetical protein AGABI2DRAFT_186557 [Agaricus bisporus var. bisporus H97]
MEMMTEFLAADPEHVWLPLIKQRESSLNFDSSAGVEELLALYERAESDYLSIALLQRHLQFIIDRFEKYHGNDSELKPAELGDIFSERWTREAITRIVDRGRNHLTQSCLLWDVHRDWELERLAEKTGAERDAVAEQVEQLFLDRLLQPHSNNEETFQAYSTFTTNFKPPADYEKLLVAASKARSQANRSWERREAIESTLRKAPSLDNYGACIACEWRAKRIDPFTASGIYERAIADAATKQFRGEFGASEALSSFWTGYLDAMRSGEAGFVEELRIVQRAVRSVPGSGEVWARYMRLLERFEDASEDENEEGRETVHDVFTRAFQGNILQQNPEQLIPVVLARAGSERRKIESGRADEDSLATLISILESGIEIVLQATKAGDTRLRLEKALADVYERLAQMPESACDALQAVTKRQKSSYIAWTTYTEVLIKNQKYDEARSVFSDVCLKQLDWPEAIWEAWISFENLYGGVMEVEACSEKVLRAQYFHSERRAKEAEKYAQQMPPETQAQVVLQEAVNMIDGNQSLPGLDAASLMEVDTQEQVHVKSRGAKRGLEEEPTATESNKKLKPGKSCELSTPKPQPLKRDRENCTVFVTDLPRNATNDDLFRLFKDCGGVREVKIMPFPDILIATVEFHDRESVPAALTKDKKRISEQEVGVHLAWKSTLYYGTILETRWPSKKFKATRRFCYVQYISPAAAQAALELHGRELEPGLPVSVFISNPERKKERTDRDADEREIYVAGLSKFTTKGDLEKIFRTYGKVKDIRLAAEGDGHAKGYAFVEYENASDAQLALAANNHELKRRRIAVTLADPRVRARHKTIAETGLTRTAEIRQRSVRIRGLPHDAQEGLLQQTLEKIASVRRVEFFGEKREAVAELENAAEAGKLLLRSEPIVYNGHILNLSEEKTGESSAPTSKAGGMFVPRKAGSQRKAGLGFTRNPAKAEKGSGASASGSGNGDLSGDGKGQDDFRKMLMGKK